MRVTLNSTYIQLQTEHRGGSRVWKRGVHFVEKEKVEDQKKKKRRSRMSEGSSNNHYEVHNYYSHL